MTVTFRIPVPHVTPGLISNLLGVVGFAAILAAVAFLLDWRWSLLGAGVVLVAMSYAAHASGQPAKSRPAAPVASVADRRRAAA